MIAGYLSSRAPVKGAAFTNLTGLGRQLPTAGVLFFFGSMALAGLPPLNGFISKFWLFKSGVEADRLWILGLIGFSGLLTLIYTLRAFQKIWWQADETERQVKKGDSLLAPAFLISLCILFGLWPERLVELAHAAASWMIDPAQYITLVLGG
jgi:formate hydrogenlyase subunit 3/multisubunit Na+/H+ antiporter MnhD subunit